MAFSIKGLGSPDRFENSRVVPRVNGAQDTEVPIERTCEFLEWSGRTCPFRHLAVPAARDHAGWAAVPDPA